MPILPSSTAGVEAEIIASESGVVLLVNLDAISTTVLGPFTRQLGCRHNMGHGLAFRSAVGDPCTQ